MVVADGLAGPARVDIRQRDRPTSDLVGDPGVRRAMRRDLSEGSGIEQALAPRLQRGLVSGIEPKVDPIGQWIEAVGKQSSEEASLALLLALRLALLQALGDADAFETRDVGHADLLFELLDSLLEAQRQLNASAAPQP